MDFRCVEENLRETFRALARYRASGDVREMNGISIASSGVQFQMFNAAFASSPVSANGTDLDRRILTAMVHFNARGIPWSFWLCEDWLPAKIRRRARQVFEKRHLTLAVELPGMIAERLLPPKRKPPELEIRRVDGEETRLAFCDIGTVCFHVPMEWFREVFSQAQLWKHFAGYVGYVRGEPVSTAATFVAAGAVGVYNVATLPQYQRRGYAEAVMRFALDQAQQQHGIERTILQSSEQGLPLYLQMGYSKVTNFAVYNSAEP